MLVRGEVAVSIKADAHRVELCLKFCHALSNAEMERFLSYGDPLSAYCLRHVKDAINSIVDNSWGRTRGRPPFDVGTLESPL